MNLSVLNILLFVIMIFCIVVKIIFSRKINDINGFGSIRTVDSDQIEELNIGSFGDEKRRNK